MPTIGLLLETREMLLECFKHAFLGERLGKDIVHACRNQSVSLVDNELFLPYRKYISISSARIFEVMATIGIFGNFSRIHTVAETPSK